MSERSNIWSWVVAAYAVPGVAAQCLNLQDEHDQNVPLLLWACWAATQMPVDQALTMRAAGMAREWSAAAIIPLRKVRRRLKASVSDGDMQLRQALREQVKAVELQAEKVLLEQLEALTIYRGCVAGERVPVVMLDALMAAASAWSGDCPAEKLAILTQTLSEWQNLRYKG